MFIMINYDADKMECMFGNSVIHELDQDSPGMPWTRLVHNGGQTDHHRGGCQREGGSELVLSQIGLGLEFPMS